MRIGSRHDPYAGDNVFPKWSCGYALDHDLDLTVILYNDELRRVFFVLNGKDLTWTEVHRLAHLLNQFQGRTFIEHMHRAVRVPLLKDLRTGQHTGAASNALLSVCDHSHSHFSFPDMSPLHR